MYLEIQELAQLGPESEGLDSLGVFLSPLKKLTLNGSNTVTEVKFLQECLRFLGADMVILRNSKVVIETNLLSH